MEGTPGNRYKAVMDLLNIKKLDSVQQDLSRSIKVLKNELDNKKYSYDQDVSRLEELKNTHESKLQSLSNIKNFNDTFIKDIENNKKLNDQDIEKLSKLTGNKKEECQKYIDEINELLKIKELELINYDTELDKYVGKLYSTPIFSIDEKIEEFVKVYDKLDLKIENRINKVLEEYEIIASDSLKSSQYLIKTLESSMEYIKVTNPDNCPICNRDIDSDSIIDEISENISKINSSNDALDNWKKNLKKLLSYIDNELKNYEELNHIISQINSSINTHIEIIDLTILNDLKTELGDLSEFKIPPSDINNDFKTLYDNANSIKLNVVTIDINGEKSEYENIIAKLNDLNRFKLSDVDIDNLEKQIKQRKTEIDDKTRQLAQNEVESKELENDIIKYEKDINELKEYVENFDDIILELEKRVELASLQKQKKIILIICFQ